MIVPEDADTDNLLFREPDIFKCYRHAHALPLISGLDSINVPPTGP